MPKRREVPSLQSLSISSVVSLVASVKSRIDLNEEPQTVDSELQKSISCLRELLYSHVPFALYDEVAVEVLDAVEELIYKTELDMKHYKEMNPNSSPPQCLENANVIAYSLPMAVLTSKLSTIVDEWSIFLSPILYNNLHKLTGLKTLNLYEYLGHKTTTQTLRFQECMRNMGGSCDDNPDDYLLNCIAEMKHLKSLYFSDSNNLLVQTVGENCPLLQQLDLCESSQSSITDDCIPYLLKCQNLKKLNLDYTSISTLGHAQLIAGLPKLQDISLLEPRVDIEGIMKELHQQYSYCVPFGLRKIITHDMSRENLQLCASLFPKLEEVELHKAGSGIADFTVLMTPLDQLNSIELESYSFYSDHMKQLLEAKGGNITCLDLGFIYELDFNALIDLGQYCPKLIVLKFSCCDFKRDRPISYDKLKVQPFQCLEELVYTIFDINWMEEKLVCSQHVEFILVHAVNIRYVKVEFLTHSSIVNILAVNVMKQLEKFEVASSDDMSMLTVELLLEKCESIKVLGELPQWREISTEELERFKKYIKENNLDLCLSDSLGDC